MFMTLQTCLSAQAYELGMYGAKYLWLLAGRYPDNWWRVPDPKVTCSVKDIEEAMDGFIGTDVLSLSTSDEPTFGGLVSGALFSAQCSQSFCFSFLKGSCKPIPIIFQYTYNLSWMPFKRHSFGAD